MSKSKALIVIMVLTLVITMNNSSVLASDSKIVDPDLQNFAMMIVNNQFSNDEITKFNSNLTFDEQKELTSIVIENMPDKYKRKPGEHPKRIESNESIDSDTNSVNSCDPAASPFCWRQLIEPGKIYRVVRYANFTYETATTCDNDPSDYDQILYFYPYNYQSNPDGLTWDTTSNAIWQAALTSHNTNLNAYGANSNLSDVRLCIPSSISIPFTDNLIMNNIFLGTPPIARPIQ